MILFNPYEQASKPKLKTMINIINFFTKSSLTDLYQIPSAIINIKLIQNAGSTQCEHCDELLSHV